MGTEGEKDFSGRMADASGITDMAQDEWNGILTGVRRSGRPSEMIREEGGRL